MMQKKYLNRLNPTNFNINRIVNNAKYYINIIIAINYYCFRNNFFKL